MKKLFTLFIFSWISLFCFAQQGFEAGGWIGVSNYFGDLNTTFRLDHPGLSLGVIARYNFNERLCMKLSANYGKVSAFDSDSNNSFEKARNLSFESVIFDGTWQFEFNFLPYIHGSSDQFFTPYIFAGFSVLHFEPKAELEGQKYNLREFGTEGQFKGEEYYSITGGLAYGIGLKVDLNYEWSINIELGARSLFTDYLDDVSGVYPDMDDLEALHGIDAVRLSDRSWEVPELTESPIGETGRQRGNSNNNDKYVMLGIGLVYYFGDLRCPPYTK